MTLLSKLVPQLEQTYTWYGEVVHPYLDPGLQICKRTCVNHPVIVLSSSIVGLSIVYYYASRPRNLPPGPIGFPFIGSPHLFGDDVNHDFDRLSKKYGDIYTLFMGWRPMIIINSHRLIKEAFIKRGEDFANRPVMYGLNQMNLFDELFNHHYTPEWKVHKKFMMRVLRNHGFGSISIEGLFQQNLDKLYAYFDSTMGQEIDLAQPLANLTGCTIAAISYGGRYNFNDPELKLLQKLVLGWVDAAFRLGMSISYWIDCVPIWVGKLVFPAVMKNLEDSNGAFQDFLIEKIREHRETLDPSNPRDVMDAYLIERGDDPDLTELKLAGTILMTLPDAVDTASILMNWISLYLALYPEWQKKVQDQIDSVCGSRRPGFSDRSNLPLVEATIAECGRLSCVVSLSIAHSPTHDTHFEGYAIPEDSYILANIWAAHREKEIFPQGGEFEPWRLINTDGSMIKTDKITYFSSGRRMCPGEQMVKNETFLYVSNTLQRYTIKLPPGKPKPTLRDHGGLIRSPHHYDVLIEPRGS